MNARQRGRKAVREARADLGVRESPAGSNLQKFGKFWGENGVPWCGLAVAYWWRMAGFNIDRDLAHKIDYVPALVHLAANKQHRLSLVHRLRARAGDAVCFDFDGGTEDHVGLFVRWIDKKAGVFETIEGNTSVGNNSNGGQVMLRTRYINQVAAFVRKLPG